MAGTSPRAGDAGVPPSRGTVAARARRPRPTRRREASRAHQQEQPRRHPAGDQAAPRPGRPGRTRTARPRHGDGRRRPGTGRTAARQPACLARRRGQRAERLRLEEPDGPTEVRADQGPARPRDARPAVRGHEAGARERHRRRPGRGRADDAGPQRAARRPPSGRGQPGAVRRVHGEARRPVPVEPAERRRTARRPGVPRRRRPADAELDDAGAAGRTRCAGRAGVRLPRADGGAVPARREPPCPPPRRGLGRLRGHGRRAGTRPRRRHRGVPGHRRPRRAGRPARPGRPRVRARRPGPRRPRAAARRPGGRRRPDPAAAREGAAELGRDAARHATGSSG